MSGIWKKFNPANDLYDQPLAYRGTIAPFGTYTNPDGSESAGFAWPGMITEPLNALQRLHENSYTEDGRLGMPNPQYQGNKDDALTALLSIYAGNALNHATRLPENAVKYPNRFEGVGDPSYMMLNTGNVKHARTGETLYSDTVKPSLAGSAIAADQDEISLDEFLRRYGVTY